LKEGIWEERSEREKSGSKGNIRRRESKNTVSESSWTLAGGGGTPKPADDLGKDRKKNGRGYMKRRKRS